MYFNLAMGEYTDNATGLLFISFKRKKNELINN